MTWRAGVVLLICAAAAVGATGPARTAPAMTTIADGVYLFNTAPYGDVGLDGNSIAIIGSNGVAVFDSNGTPAAASAVLAEIRRLTSQPVRYVINSHWHWDHWYGTEVYRQAFPAVSIVAHDKTRELMMGPALAFNQPGIETQLPEYIAALKTKVDAAEAATPRTADADRLQQLLAADRFFLEQKRNVHLVFPDVTFSDHLTLHLGDVEVRVLHYGRGVTPGDAFVYLPKQKVVITGDLLVNPISFALDCYPSEWLQTLERIDALEADTIVPGHGAPLHDKRLLHATINVFRRMIDGGEEARRNGVDVHGARDAMWPSIRASLPAFTGGEVTPAVESAFRVQLVDWFLHRVYDELNGPLTDDIAPIPPS